MPKTVLEKIVRLCEAPPPRVVLLTDSREVCGRGLVYSMVRAHLRNTAHVHYLTTFFAPEQLEPTIRCGGTSGKLEFYDGAADPCGWNNYQNKLSLSQPLPEMFSKVGESAGQDQTKAVVVVDRVEHLTHHQSPSQLITGLHKLATGQQVEQVIVWCGRDTAPESLLSALTHLCAAVVHVLPTHPCSCHVLLKKSSGKVLKGHEEFSLSTELQLQNVRPVQKKDSGGEGEGTGGGAGAMLASATFNLSLTHDQRRAKNSLLLPHIRVQGEGGQIHYTPDEVDDWDEEDPDDDLDI